MKNLKIIFEDDWILVVDKPSGQIVNKSQTASGGTLQDELGDYLELGASLGIGDRAGIVHRLDRETSGLLLIAKTKAAFLNLQAQFKERDVQKRYIALVHGRVGQDEGIIESKISRIKFGKFGISDSRSKEGREAKTDYRVDCRYLMSPEIIANMITQGSFLPKGRINYLKVHAKDYSLLTVLPKTGRTHQIRVHLKSIGNPVVSDLIYSPSKLLKFDLLWCPRLFLHAAFLEFTHPKTKKRVEFESGLPTDLEKALDHLGIC